MQQKTIYGRQAMASFCKILIIPLATAKIISLRCFQIMFDLSTTTKTSVYISTVDSYVKNIKMTVSMFNTILHYVHDNHTFEKKWWDFCNKILSSTLNFQNNVRYIWSDRSSSLKRLWLALWNTFTGNWFYEHW